MTDLGDAVTAKAGLIGSDGVLSPKVPGRWPTIGVAFLMCLAGCDRSSYLEKKAPEDVASAKAHFELLRRGQYEQVENDLDPSVKSPDIHAKLAGIAVLIPVQNPQSIKTISLNTGCNGVGTCDTYIVLEYRYPTERLLLNVVIKNEGAESSIMGMHLRDVLESTIEANRFTFLGKGLSQYAVFLSAALVPLFTVYALVLCIRESRIGKRKWLWAVFIAMGVGQFGVNWTTGELGLYLLSAQVLSVGWHAELYGPWVISVSLPLGAVFFLLYRRTLNTPTQTSPSHEDISNCAR